ncbi:metalloregulator ArsR/SmtB family transcription factor [Desulfitobacterium sp.]|uniref:ArsR/SmtB family transcription factor n=1 Tax=Desulfitobacterium sp. TaxID=49981 RepID=UPI002B51D2B5|nr:metalloregulator ArsR/SmtB family transcription factor [Desulfitobacterium sp.]HVJ49895.1 metalloregulator ArsR/SmtB family transcription factor [Desulfitobacterium sp.]
MADKELLETDNNLVAESLICEVECIHPEVIDRFANRIIDVNQANDLADLFKTLGDPTRIRIVDALALAKGEFCVCDLAELLGLSQSATSHQLRVLRNSKLVKFHREGKMVYYSLDDDHVLGLYRQGLEHISER